MARNIGGKRRSHVAQLSVPPAPLGPVRVASRSRGRIAFGSMNDLIDARDLLPIRRDLLPIDAPAPSPERLMWLRSSSQRKAKGSGCVRLLAGLGTQACPSDPRGCWGRTKTDLEASSAT